MYFDHFIPLTDDSGRLRIRSYGHLSGMWGTLAFPAVGNSPLAFEFALHLVDAMVNPVGAAQYHAYYTLSPMPWGAEGISTPIKRSLFEQQITQSLAGAAAREFSPRNPDGRSIFDDAVRDNSAEAIENAISKLAVYNEMPMVHPPFLPTGLRNGLIDILTQFGQGLLAPEATAQQMRNRVALWLIE